ncbi:hypothetical protein Pla163_36130 [Planctomycetes bacterium Pla163]|uniref:Uncharacterized protein n=1 Tax=Rohdeia mirabilis TaxID=2528008 RepID=A0A518D4Q9_9BACT|nr:hypothetical protein Pla163_36130 [Planctomycetes bacterium Pla163]
MGSVLKRTNVALDAAPARSGVRNEPSCGRPVAELIHVDGRPYAIEITCTCGERTLVELVADRPAPAAPASEAPASRTDPH